MSGSALFGLLGSVARQACIAPLWARILVAPLVGCSGSGGGSWVISQSSEGGGGGSSNGEGGSRGSTDGGGGGAWDGASMPTDSGNGSDPYAAERQKCFDVSNQFRMKAGVPALVHATDKESCLDGQARMEQQKNLIDYGPPWQCGAARQNHGDGDGYLDSELVDFVAMILTEQFNEGPGGPHYDQMTDPNMTQVACGFSRDPSDPVTGNFWFDTDFY